MISNFMLITSIIVFFGLPALLVLSACIAAARADHQEEQHQRKQMYAANNNPVYSFQRAAEKKRLANSEQQTA